MYGPLQTASRLVGLRPVFVEQLLSDLGAGGTGREGASDLRAERKIKVAGQIGGDHYAHRAMIRGTLPRFLLHDQHRH